LAIGYDALGGSIAGGEFNVAIGNYSMDALTSGDYNTAVGYNSLTAITTGENNTAAGYNALSSNAGSDNTAIGFEAVQVTSGSNNTGVGFRAINNVESADNNTALGHRAGDVITTGANNIIIGQGSDPSGAAGANQIVIGTGATGHGDNIAVIGNGSTTAIHPHDNNEVDLGSTSYKYKNLFLTGSPIVGVSNAITSSATFNGSELIIPVNASSANITLTIDTDQCFTGRILMIRKIDSTYDYSITIATEGSETLSAGTTHGAATLTVGSGTGRGIILFSDGSNWYDFIK
jgi:hypothetical protein